MKQVELLAPAGNKENFIGAINAGANAVYLSGTSYGARAYASNFTKEEICELITYAHVRNVKVFVTVNTIIFEEEMTALLAYTDFLVRHHVDALIVQDFGLIKVLVKRYPDTEIHASTQMNVYTIQQAKYLKELGVNRIIFARETSLDTIKKIKKEVDIDCEVFIHGALCVSYSGNCLFSALNGGRSGNRGECAQPCRLPYTLLKEHTPVSNEAYLMSTKDLLTIQHINDIIEAGITSLKIEGRMRSFEYVTETTRTYRERINQYYKGTIADTKETITRLKTVFNRDYTKGYILNEEPYAINNAYRPNHQGIDVGVVTHFKRGKTTIKLNDTLHKGDGIRILGNKDVGGKVNKIRKNNKDVLTAYKGDTIIIDMLGSIQVGSIVRKTMDIKLNQSVEDYKKENYKLTPLYMHVISKVGYALTCKMQTPFSEDVSVTADYIVPLANNKPQTKEVLIEQFTKLGNTHYDVKHISIDTDERGFIPNRIINSLRRNTIQKLESQILSANKKIIIPYQSPSLQPTYNEEEMIIKVENMKQYQIVKALGFKTIYFTKPIEDNYVFLNRITQDRPQYQKMVVHDFGYLKEDKDIITSEHVNVVNSYTVEALLATGVKAVTLSLESDKENTRNIVSNFYSRHQFYPPLEVIVYSTPDVMISKYCPITKALEFNKKNCGICEKNQFYLQDGKQRTYPLIRDNDCAIRILHNQVLNNTIDIDYYRKIGIKRFRFDFTLETPNEIKAILTNYIKSNQS